MKLIGDHILTWIDKHFNDYKVRKSSTEIVMANPWGDSGKHLNVSLVEKEIGVGRNKRKGFWVHDWRPGHQEHDGSFFRFVADYKNITYREAAKEVCGVAIDPRSFFNKEKEEEKLPEDVEVTLPDGARSIADESDSTAYKMTANYLESRNISLGEAKQAFIHYDSTSIIFPYVEFGVVVYWMRRSLVGKSFEYPPESIGAAKSEFLYGFDNVEPGSPLIVVESAICSLSIGPGAVATGGDTASKRQVKKARLLNPSSVILGGDNDTPDSHGIRPGIEAILTNHELFRPYFNIFFALPQSPHKDWNDLKVAGIDPRQYIESHMTAATPTSLVMLRNSK